MRLENKVAIVTGGATGIGKAISLEFARAGADVVVCSRNVVNIETVRDEIAGLGRRSLAIPMDVCTRPQVVAMVQAVVEEFGKIDILVNNSGAARDKLITDMDDETWDLVLDTNLKGVFLCTQAVVGHMIKRSYGKIVNISSSASIGAIEPGQAAYAAAKSAVNAFTKACAREFGAYGINVNAIAPGRILTPLVYQGKTEEQIEEFMQGGARGAVLGRLGTPEEIAHLALFLASDDAAYITSEIIACNGGRTNLMRT